MIAVTRLDGSSMIVNVDLIESIERTPDTLISLVHGVKLLVRETPEQLVEQVIQFKRAVSSGTATRRLAPDRGAADEE